MSGFKPDPVTLFVVPGFSRADEVIVPIAHAQVALRRLVRRVRRVRRFSQESEPAPGRGRACAGQPLLQLSM